MASPVYEFMADSPVIAVYIGIAFRRVPEFFRDYVDEVIGGTEIVTRKVVMLYHDCLLYTSDAADE